MNRHRGLAAVLTILILSWGALDARADFSTITEWNFNTIGVKPAPYNSPAPTTGTGTAIILGMNNSYNGGNTANADILLTAGTADPSFTEDTWRIRGTSHNGWATHAAGAAQYTQGIELDTSTVGYTGIKFSFDWYSTTQGIRDLQFQYNLNTANSSGWTNFGGTSPTGTYIAVSNDFYNAPGSPTITVDLSGITGANNDANFGVRLVSAFDSTGNVPNDYASAQLSGGNTVIYNNSSGNWRFGTLNFSGNLASAPEPSSIALLASAGAVLAIYARKRRANV
jgi:hypothetical protein